MGAIYGKSSTLSFSLPMKRLLLNKGGCPPQVFIIDYAFGEEAAVLEELLDMVTRADLCFDWFDAAVLSHQLGVHLSQALKEFTS